MDVKPQSLPSGPVVVIGCGNDLRGDDAAGQVVARAVAEWDVPGVRALAVHQLTPELAAEAAGARLVIFVDASVEPVSAGVRVQCTQPTTADAGVGHTGDPSWLLALALAVYGRCPPAWSITIPADTFAFGETLSEAAQHGVREALDRVRALL